MSGPRAVLVVRQGPHRALRVALEPGAALTVGRTERADLVLGLDQRLAGAHFRLQWDGTRCTLRDLESGGGTAVAGQQAEGVCVVAHGSWIEAGGSVFSLYHEAETPPRERADSAPSGVDSQGTEASTSARGRERALGELRPRLGHLYVVLDSARDERVAELVREAVDPSRSLYEGPRGEALADVAPYLVQLRADSQLLDRLVAEGWGRSWGVFLDSRLRFELMRRHLRRFLVVEAEPTDEQLYFRYYDPRVLRDFLPLATVRQLSALLADIDVVLLEDDAGELAYFATAELLRARGVPSEEDAAP